MTENQRETRTAYCYPCIVCGAVFTRAPQCINHTLAVCKLELKARGHGHHNPIHGCSFPKSTNPEDFQMFLYDCPCCFDSYYTYSLEGFRHLRQHVIQTHLYPVQGVPSLHLKESYHKSKLGCVLNQGYLGEISFDEFIARGEARQQPLTFDNQRANAPLASDNQRVNTPTQPAETTQKPNAYAPTEHQEENEVEFWLGIKNSVDNLSDMIRTMLTVNNQ